MATEIPTINFNDFLNQLHTDFCSDFHKTFNIAGNGILHCKNPDIPTFNNFLDKYANFFRANSILLPNFQLETMGQASADIMHMNKKKLMIIYGAAFQMYLKSCLFLGKQPNNSYADSILIKLE